MVVLEKRDHTGGAAVSARPFAGVDARLSRYAYLLSLLPAAIVADLELPIRTVRRRVASFTPDPRDSSRGLLIDRDDPAATRAALTAIGGSAAVATGWEEMYARLGRLATRMWPTVLEPLRHADEIRALVDDDELWHMLTGAPLGAMLRRFLGDDVVAGVAATDALIGTFASIDDPVLMQNVCFLYHVIGGGTGDWDVPVGGMGAVSAALTAAARAAGARVLTSATVTAIDPDGAVRISHGGRVETIRGGTIHIGCAPAIADRLLGATGALPLGGPPHTPTVDGAQLKLNMLLTRLPRLRAAAVEPATAFAGTLHVNESLGQLETAYRQAREGRIPQVPPCEIYCHTLSDRSILGDDLAASDAQTMTVFGLHMPAHLFRDDAAEARRAAVAATIRSIESVLAEPLEPLLVRAADGSPCIEAATPLDLEADLDLPGGNIFHRPLRWPWAESVDEVGRWGVETRYPNVFICGAGARRGGGVSGIAGHNAARAALAAR